VEPGGSQSACPIPITSPILSALEAEFFGTWRAKTMSKTTLSMMSSLLLSTALAAPAVAAEHHFAHLSGHLARRLADPDLYPGPAHIQKQNRSANTLPKRPVALDSGFTIIDHPDAGGAPGQGTRVWAINDKGLVGGQYRDKDSVMHAFLLSPDLQTFTTWQVGTYFTTGSFGSPNNKGDVGGSFFTDDGVEHGYLRRYNGTISTFDVSSCVDGVAVFAINDKAAIVGSCYDEDFVVHGFLRTREGAITVIDEDKAGTNADQGTFPQGINDSGEVVGSYLDSNFVLHAFIRSPDGGFAEYDAPGAGQSEGQGTDAWFVRNDGTIGAGYADSGDIFHGYIRHPDGTFTAPIDAPDSPATEIQALRGKLAVGDYFDADGTDHAFMRDGKGKLTPFDAPGAGEGDGLGTSPAWMNKSKVVAGWLLDDNDVRHGFLRTP